MRAASLVVLTTAISGGICYHETEVLSGEVNTTMQNMHWDIDTSKDPIQQLNLVNGFT